MFTNQFSPSFCLLEFTTRRIIFIAVIISLYLEQIDWKLNYADVFFEVMA